MASFKTKCTKFDFGWSAPKLDVRGLLPRRGRGKGEMKEGNGGRESEERGKKTDEREGERG